MKSLILALALSLVPASAMASGGFHCQDVESPDLEFGIAGVTSRSFGQSLVDANGVLRFKPIVGQPTKDTITLGRTHVAQYWNQEDTFNLVLWYEKETPKALEYSVDVVLKTTSTDGVVYTGTYDVFFFGGGKSASFTGRPVVCEVQR